MFRNKCYYKYLINAVKPPDSHQRKPIKNLTTVQRERERERERERWRKVVELLGSKAGVSSGRFHHGTAFGESNGQADTAEIISETLVRHGFSYTSKDFLYSGSSGMPLQSYVFMGPLYYQTLKHLACDKMHAYPLKTRNNLTGQLLEGIRVGEMERDCLIAYGASLLIHERLMISGDSIEVQVCGTRGLLGYYNYKMKTGICSMCKNVENMSTVEMPYALKLLFQELQAMNIVPRLKLGEP